MMYTPYVSPEEYYNDYGGSVPADSINQALIKASKHIDELTFNRIVHKGFDKLSTFQQDTVKAVVCMHADFLYENSDIISSPFSEYSINNVSMKFGDSVAVVYEAGIPIERSVYAILKQTGLCCRLAV